jgi:uncharacterized protein (DUF2235 family)
MTDEIGVAGPRSGARRARGIGAPKRIIVCCDGTWNDSVSSDSPLTNVARISRLIADTGKSGIAQVVYYHTGVGSGTSQLGNIIDGMSGRGKMVLSFSNIHSRRAMDQEWNS